MNMNDLIDRYEKECIPELRPRSQRDYLGILKILRHQFGSMEPGEIKPRHIVEFLNVEKGRIHRNRMVTILSTIFYKAIGKWCIDDDLRNPCTPVEKWPTKARTRYIEDKEFKDFRATCRAQVQIAMDLAYLTAQRQSDIVGLTWKQVKAIGLPRDKWHVEVQQGKTGKKLAITITPDLEAVLKRAKLMEPHWPREYVIRTKWGLKYTEDGFRAMWQRYMRAWMAAGNENFHFHDIRAKSLTDNPSLQAAYELSGHIDIRMTRRVYDRGTRKVEPLK